MLLALVLAALASPQEAPVAGADQWDRFPAFLWRLRYRDERPPDDLLRFGGVDVKRDEDADWAREAGLSTYIGHAPGRDDLHLDADSPAWSEPWRAWVAGGASRGESAESAARLVRNPCLTAPETRARLSTTLLETLRRHRDSGALFFSLGDEIGLTPSQGVPWDGCRSETCRAEWRRHNHDAPMPTTDEARRAWIAGDPVLLGAWLGLRRFHRGVVMETVMRLAHVAHAASTDTLLPSDARRVPCAVLGAIGATPFGAVDLRGVVQFVDVVECYPEDDARADVETLRTLEPYRSRADPLRTLRTVFVADDSPGGAAWQVSEHWVRGGDGVVIWCDADVEDRPAHAARLLEALAAVRALGPHHPAPAGVAVLRDDDSRALCFLEQALLDGPTWPNRFPSYQRDHGLVEVAVEGWLRLFEDLGHHPGVVRFETLDAERFPVVVLPHVRVAGDAEERRLERFLRANGVLLVEGELGTHDASGRPAAAGAPTMTERLAAAFPGQVVAAEIGDYRERRLALDAEQRAARLPSAARAELAERGHAPLPIAGADGTPWLVTRERLADGGLRVAAIPNLVTPAERARLADARILPPRVPAGMRLLWRSPAPVEGAVEAAGEVVVPAGAALVFELAPER